MRRVANDGNLCTFDNTGTLDAYVEQATPWRNVGKAPECTVSRKSIASGAMSATTDTYRSVDMVDVNGYRVVAFRGAYHIGATVYDVETGAIVYPATTFANAGSFLADHDIIVVAAGDGTRAHVIYAKQCRHDALPTHVQHGSHFVWMGIGGHRLFFDVVAKVFRRVLHVVVMRHRSYDRDEPDYSVHD